MGEWLASHPGAVTKGALAGLVSLIAIGGLALVARTPRPAPIVVSPITPWPTTTRSSTATPLPIRVYVSGAVAAPGVYTLTWDGRIEQAIVAAGGALPEADLSRINLAQRIYDEAHIHVPEVGETGVVPLTPGSGATPAAASARLNINTATVAELVALPGIGPTLAQRIVDYRQANGPFRRPEDIQDVTGIGAGIYAEVRDLISTE